MTEQDFHRSTLAGLRRARRQLEHLGDRILDELAPVRQAQRMGSNLHYDTMSRTCRAAFFVAGQEVAQTIIEMKGNRAPNRKQELERALAELQAEVLVRFDAQDGRALYGEPMAQRQALVDFLENDASGIVLDFMDGITPMKQPGATTDNSVHVHAGDNSNVALASGGSTMSMRDQSVTQSVNETEVLAALAELSKLIANSALSVEEKEQGLDAVTLARVEISGEKDPGRLKRYAAKAADFAGKVGASALGGTISAYATATLKSLGL